MSTPLNLSNCKLAAKDFFLGLTSGSCGVVCAGIEASAYLTQLIGTLGCSISIPQLISYPMDKKYSTTWNNDLSPWIFGKSKPIPPLAERVTLVFASYGLLRLGMDIQSSIQPMRVALLASSIHQFQKAYSHLSS